MEKMNSPKSQNKKKILQKNASQSNEEASKNNQIHQNSKFNIDPSFQSPKQNNKNSEKRSSSDMRMMQKIQDKIKVNQEEVSGLSFEPLILECRKLIVLMRNICARKGILLLEEIQHLDKDGLGVISTNRLGFILESLVGLNGRQIKTLLGFFDSFHFGYVNIKDFCVSVSYTHLTLPTILLV